MRSHKFIELEPDQRNHLSVEDNQQRENWSDKISSKSSENSEVSSQDTRPDRKKL